jgi:hypothetical protein
MKAGTCLFHGNEMQIQSGHSRFPGKGFNSEKHLFSEFFSSYFKVPVFRKMIDGSYQKFKKQGLRIIYNFASISLPSLGKKSGTPIFTLSSIPSEIFPSRSFRV